MDHQLNCWGISSGIDLYECDLNLMQNEADDSRAIRLDTFSCAPYDSNEAAACAAHFFKAQRCNTQVVMRS
jgi:hypothetical protein